MAPNGSTREERDGHDEQEHRRMQPDVEPEWRSSHWTGLLVAHSPARELP